MQKPTRLKYEPSLELLLNTDGALWDLAHDRLHDWEKSIIQFSADLGSGDRGSGTRNSGLEFEE